MVRSGRAPLWRKHAMCAFVAFLRGWSLPGSRRTEVDLTTDAISASRQRFESEALPQLDALFIAGLRLTRNEAEAKDLCQETMLRAYRAFRQFTPGTNCRAWLMTILYNLFRDGFRRRQREQVMADPEQFERIAETQGWRAHCEPQQPEPLLLGQISRSELSRALQDLPEEFRAALLLVDVQDLPYRDAARVLQVPVGTVRSRVSRGRARMRAALQDLLQDGGRAA